MSCNTVYGFMDANVFMHFQTFDEIDWSGKLGADHVHLVVAPSVLRELNKYKDDSTNTRRRDRVRSILSKLKPLLNSGDVDNPAFVRSGVTIFDIVREPRVDWSALGLDQLVEDDRLLATIIQFEPSEPGRKLLITNDFPPQRKAGGQGIEFWEPEGEIERLDLSSSENAKIKQLEQQNRELLSRIPKVSLDFWEVGKAVRMVTRSAIAARINGWTDPAINDYVAQKQQEFEQTVARARDKVNHDDIKDYRYACKTYLKNLKTFLFKARALSYERGLELAFILRNIGQVPLENAGIELAFPSESFVVALSERDSDVWGFGDVKQPKEPVPEWEKLRDPWRSYSFSPRFLDIDPINVAREPVPKGPLYDEDDRSRVEYEHPSLRPKEDWRMEPVVAYIPLTGQGGFQIDYVLRADNLPDPYEGQLNVILQYAEKEGVS